MRMPAIHCCEDPVRPGLHWQMQIWHQAGHVAMGGDQIILHIQRMRGCVSDAIKPINFRKRQNQSCKAPA